MLLMGKRKIVNPDFGVFKPLVAFTALGVGDLGRLGQGNGSLRVTFGAGGLFAGVAFETGLLRGSKGRWIVRVVINIVMASGTGILESLDVKAVRDGNIVRVDFGRGSFHIKNTGMAADAVGIDLVKLGGKTGMFSFALKGEDVDARHQGVARGVTFRAVNLGMKIRLLPEGGFSLLMMAGDTEFLLRCRIGGQGHCGIQTQDRQNAPKGPTPERQMRHF